MRKPLKARGQATSKAKGKGKGKDAEQGQSEDDWETSDHNVVMQETPMPHVHSRYDVVETPFEGIVVLLFLVLV